MAARRKNDNKSSETRRRPATTPEGRENQMISLAVDLAEKQLKEGTATSQVITHYLKLGTSREQLEQERLAHENELLKARTEALASAQRMEELYSEAIKAMRSYAGDESSGDEEEDDYED